MNKYQEALDYLLILVNKEIFDKVELRGAYKHIFVLRELVDKVTPKKVIKCLNDKSMACCPICHNAEYAEEMPIHCHCCGQPLDWSKDE